MRPPLYRIDLGRDMRIAPDQSRISSYVVKLGGQDDGRSCFVTHSSNSFGRQIAQIEGICESRQSGVYADEEGKLLDFARGLTPGRIELKDLIPRIIDLRPIRVTGYDDDTPIIDMIREMDNPRRYAHPYKFVLDKQNIAYGSPPTAARILLDQARRKEVNGIMEITLGHEIESYMFVAAILRQLGYSAYPAQAVIGNEDGQMQHSPLIVVIDFKQYELWAFDLLRKFPSARSIDIVDDQAVFGATLCAYAEGKIRRMGMDMYSQAHIGQRVSKESLRRKIGEIATTLKEAEANWPKCPYIDSAMIHAYEVFFRYLLAVEQCGRRNDVELTDPIGFDPISASSPDNLEARARAEATMLRARLAGRFSELLRAQE